MNQLGEWAHARGWRAEPWRNGRGVTYVIARWPAAQTGEDYDVRVSIAEVTESGPFSLFPGRVRWSTLVSDGAIMLGEHALRRGVPVELAGDEPVTAILAAGPVILLNIVARPGHVEVGAGPSPDDADFAFDAGDDIVWLRFSRRPTR